MQGENLFLFWAVVEKFQNVASRIIALFLDDRFDLIPSNIRRLKKETKDTKMSVKL